MKILFILPEYYPHSGGGIATYYQHYIKSLLPHVEEIRVITGSGYVQSDEDFETGGVRVEYLRPALYREFMDKFTRYDLLPEFKRNLAAAWAMWAQSGHGEGYDLVECTDFGLGFIPWVVERSRPVVTRLHGSTGQISLYETGLQSGLEEAFFQQAELALLPACDGLVSHSSANLRFWETALDKPRISMISPAYDSDYVSPLPRTERAPYGLVTGRIQHWKGPVQLCKAYALLKGPHPQIRWIGRDKAYRGKESMAVYLKRRFPQVWEREILQVPALPHQKILPLQRCASFGLVPSLWDMFNFAGIEMMAAGTPLICSDGAGMAELIDPDVNGLVYPAADPEALAASIDALLRLDESAYRQMALAGQETIRNRLSPAAIIPLNLELYASVLGSFRPGVRHRMVDELYQPVPVIADLAGLLDKQPLKRLTSYYMKRLVNKLTGK